MSLISKEITAPRTSLGLSFDMMKLLSSVPSFLEEMDLTAVFWWESMVFDNAFTIFILPKWGTADEKH